jgi:hypothetical protein
MCAKPDDKNTYFVALTGCKYKEELLIQFYKITITPGGGKIKMVKTGGDDVQANNGAPIAAYHK